MYRTLTVAMAFADWLAKIAGAAATKAAHAAEVAENTAVNVVRIEEAVKLTAHQDALKRATKKLEEQRVRYSARMAKLNADHPGY